jgi:hypothetical protein
VEICEGLSCIVNGGKKEHEMREERKEWKRAREKERKKSKRESKRKKEKSKKKNQVKKFSSFENLLSGFELYLISWAMMSLLIYMMI